MGTFERPKCRSTFGEELLFQFRLIFRYKICMSQISNIKNNKKEIEEISCVILTKLGRNVNSLLNTQNMKSIKRQLDNDLCSKKIAVIIRNNGEPYEI